MMTTKLPFLSGSETAAGSGFGPPPGDDRPRQGVSLPLPSTHLLSPKVDGAISRSMAYEEDSKGGVLDLKR